MILRLFSLGFKVVNRLYTIFSNIIHQFLSYIIFFGQGIRINDFSIQGIPYISVSLRGECLIGSGFKMNNGLRSNPLGPPQRSIIFVAPHARLVIGNNVGISQTAIVCFQKITIGNNVMIGSGSRIYDTDFHSLTPSYRLDSKIDEEHTVIKPVELKDNVFIGAHSTILKGITIGENSIIGACSVVTKSIPDNEIWAGNPAKFIRKLRSENESVFTYTI